VLDLGRTLAIKLIFALSITCAKSDEIKKDILSKSLNLTFHFKKRF